MTVLFVTENADNVRKSLNWLSLQCLLLSRGQLGHGNIVNHSTPKVVEALEGVSMVSIASGGWHSAAVSGMSLSSLVISF